MSVPTFIVGTGRCGSTMLSNMLREHPKVLSLSEFFAVVTDGARSSAPFDPVPIDGEQFWSMIATVAPMPTFIMGKGIPCDEWLYPCDSSDARFSRETGVPAILTTTLPHLTPDHDALFDALSHEVTKWPIAAIGHQYRRLFGWLAEHFGKQLWVERSGAGLGMAAYLVAIFPEARFVHIARDGRDAALSMRKHKAFVLGVGLNLLTQSLGVDPLESDDRTYLDRVPVELLPLLPERVDAATLDSFSVSLELCGSFWTQQIESGLKMLSALPANSLLTLRYEDFSSDPKAQIDRLAAFLGTEFVDEEWSNRCATNVKSPRSTWRDLPGEEARALTEACRPGFELLREVGVEYAV
jgi:putative sulfotransferase